MRIEAAELRVFQIRLLFPFQTSFGVKTERTVPLLRLFSDGLEGCAEGVMDPMPLYREETIAGAINLLQQTLIPRVMGVEFSHPEHVSRLFASLRGNRMAKSVVEMAAWDLWARQQAQPLWRVLGGDGQPVPVGVSLGIQPSLEATAEIVGKHLEQGYQRIKLKIKPGWDIRMLSFVRERYPRAMLTADANSAYTLADTALLRQLDPLLLDYIEQPLAFDDLIDHAALQAQLSTAICLDESIQSAADVRKALQIRAGRVINIKTARMGGLEEVRRAHEIASREQIPLWCGGMLETGIGRAFNIHLATLPGFTKPGDTSSASRYWKRDIIQENLEADHGWMPVPAGAGTGVHLDLPFLDRLTLSKETFHA